MAATLVDSNVILDIVIDNGGWGDWSAAMVEDAAERGALVINPIIYAEVSAGFEKIEDLEDALPPEYFRRDPLPWEAGFLAGKCFERYRRRGGERRSPMPHFFIGAHAAVSGMTLLTRDSSRYRAYFPKLRIVAP